MPSKRKHITTCMGMLFQVKWLLNPVGSQSHMAYQDVGCENSVRALWMAGERRRGVIWTPYCCQQARAEVEEGCWWAGVAVGELVRHWMSDWMWSHPNITLLRNKSGKICWKITALFDRNSVVDYCSSTVYSDQCAPSEMVPLIVLRNTLVASCECITLCNKVHAWLLN